MKLRPMTLPALLNIPQKLMPMIQEFNNFDLFLLEGGRGSAKSQSAGRFILYLGDQRKMRIVCGRELATNIEESVYAVLKDLIDEFDLPYDVMAKKIKHKWSGTEINFKGFRNQNGAVAVKGLEGVDLLWIDEAQSISKQVLDVVMPTIRADNAKVIFTMNRFLREDAVPEYCIGKSSCLHIHINYFENPFCPLKLKIQAEECRARSQRDYDHIWLGHPRAQADDFLFNFDKLHRSFDIKPFGETAFKQRVIGIDFAAQGNDLCVATVLDRVSNQHWHLSHRIPWDQPDTMISVGKIVNIIGEMKPDIAVLDIGGMGKPVFDRLLEVGVKILPFDGGTTAGVDTKQHRNLRAKSFYGLKDWFDSEFLCIDKDKDMEVIKELEKIKMKYQSNGCKQIQAKVDMKKDLGYSPDNADSLNMAVWATSLLGKPNQGKSANNSRVVRKSASNRHTRSR